MIKSGVCVGYFNSAIVFTSRPDWETLLDLPSHIGLRGYRHKDTALWLLDYWSRTRQQPPGFPFTWSGEADVFSTFEGNTTTDRLEQLGQYCRTLYGWRWLRLALQVSRLTNRPVYFFAADDDLIDIGASIRAGKVDRLALLVAGNCQIDAVDGSFRVTPEFEMLDDQGDDDALEDAPRLWSVPEAWRALPFVTVRSPKELTSEREFYGNVITEWPSAAGDPEQLFGLGTWDPFLNVENSLVLEFERLATRDPQKRISVSPKRKSWWQFWR